MKEIPLSQGLIVLVDDEDYEWLKQWKWRRQKGHKTFYAKRHIQGNKNAQILMHREILKKKLGGELGQRLVTDHRNGNGLDNRRENLRLVTRSINHQNTPPYCNNTSGFKGITRNRKKWMSRIVVNGYVIHIGTFESPRMAALAYNITAHKHFGNDAYFNQVF
jgi:hypothetical protein